MCVCVCLPVWRFEDRMPILGDCHTGKHHCQHQDFQRWCDDQNSLHLVLIIAPCEYCPKREDMGRTGRTHGFQWSLMRGDSSDMAWTIYGKSFKKWCLPNYGLPSYIWEKKTVMVCPTVGSIYGKKTYQKMIVEKICLPNYHRLRRPPTLGKHNADCEAACVSVRLEVC